MKTGDAVRLVITLSTRNVGGSGRMHTMRDCIDNDNKEIFHKMEGQNAVCATLEMRNLWIAREFLLTIHLHTLHQKSLQAMQEEAAIDSPIS